MPLGTKVGLSPGDSVLDGDPAPSPQRGWSPLTNFRPTYIVAKQLDASRCHLLIWYGGRRQPRGLCVRWGPTPFPQRRRTRGGIHVYCGQTAGWIKMALGMEVGLGPVHIVLDSNTAPLPKKEAEPPQFSAHFYCGQTAGCTKMPLGMAVGLSPGKFVLDGDTVPSPKRGRRPQIFGPCLLRSNCWMDQDATWHEDRPQPRRLCVRWGPSLPPHKRGGALSPIFGPFLLWPNGFMDQYATCYGGRPRPKRHCVRCGFSYPQKKGTPTPTQFLAHVYCG